MFSTTGRRARAKSSEANGSPWWTPVELEMVVSPRLRTASTPKMLSTYYEMSGRYFLTSTIILLR